MNTVFTGIYPSPPIDREEVIRYAGMPKGSKLDMLDDCISELGQVTGKVNYAFVPVAVRDGTVDLGFCTTGSESLMRALDGCREAVVFAATAGVEFDRLIAKYGRVSPVRALIFQALGTEYAEAVCRAFCADIDTRIAQRKLCAAPRFSPGYGDLPLEMQRDIFKLLDPRRIGLSLNDSLLMSPSKSVTAIIGLRKAK